MSSTKYANFNPGKKCNNNIPLKEYYYTVTGQVIQGDNKSFSEFNPGRFKINEQLQNRTQAAGWRTPDEKASPYFDISKQFATFSTKKA